MKVTTIKEERKDKASPLKEGGARQHHAAGGNGNRSPLQNTKGGRYHDPAEKGPKTVTVAELSRWLNNKVAELRRVDSRCHDNTLAVQVLLPHNKTGSILEASDFCI